MLYTPRANVTASGIQSEQEVIFLQVDKLKTKQNKTTPSVWDAMLLYTGLQNHLDKSYVPKQTNKQEQTKSKQKTHTKKTEPICSHIGRGI